MTPTSTPPSGINPWAVATTVLSAGIIATLTGLFTMYGKQSLFEERINNQKTEIAELKTLRIKDRADFDAYKETTNQRLNSVDALKASFDNLTRYAERDRR